MGENVTTRGLDLLALPTGARLRLGPDAFIEITGLRNPCAQLDSLQPGLMAAVLDRDTHGKLIRKAGVMAVVIRGGVVRAGDAIMIVLPAGAAHGVAAGLNHSPHVPPPEPGYNRPDVVRALARRSGRHADGHR